METTLTIDRGNTAVKAHIFRNGECVAATRVESEEELRRWLDSLDGTLRPCKAIYSSVTGGSLSFPGLTGRCRVLTLTHSTPLPLEIGYSTPATLGLDRIAAAAGASMLLCTEPHPTFALVADAGTALTIDLVDSSPAFLGGNISPGLRMRLQALHEHTGALPEVSPDGSVEEFGRSTDSAIRSGCLLGMAAEIERAYTRAKAVRGAGMLILTGGDAELLLPSLDSNLPLRLLPTLVAQGLNSILNYNEDIP